MAINFFEEDISFILPQKLIFKKWVKLLAYDEGYIVKTLNYIFCSDEYLYKMNLDYLGHNTYTDILTFDNGDHPSELEGDIFISIDRVKDNAIKSNQPFEKELQRVICHGLFHLCGFKDKSPDEKKSMRGKENHALQIFPQPTVSRGTVG